MTGSVRRMRQLLPHAAEDIDLYALYRPAGGGDPNLRINMVTSLDGAVTDAAGRSGGLAGAGDRALFRMLRAHADAILVGAGTVRAEGYRPHRLGRELATRRSADGRAAPAPIVVVSRSLELDHDAPLFAEAESATVVLTSAAADAARRVALERAGGRVLVAGAEDIDLPAGLRALRAQLGVHHILCEGGPTLNAALLQAGLVDELCVTLAPAVRGRDALGLVGTLSAPVGLQLLTLVEHDGELFLRYRVDRSSGSDG